MHTVRMVIGYGFLAIGIYIAVVFLLEWRKAAPQTTGDGTGFWNRNPMLQRLVMAGQGSVTILWSKFVALVACLAGGLSQIADLTGDPQIKEYVQAIVQPKIVAGAFLLVMIVNYYSRKRTL